MAKRILILVSALIFVMCTACAKPIVSSSSAELLDLGDKYLMDMDYEQALVQYLKVIEVEPKNTEAYIKAAEVYMKLEQLDKAIAILEQGFGETGDEQVNDMLVEVAGIADSAAATTTAATTTADTTTSATTTAATTTAATTTAATTTAATTTAATTTVATTTVATTTAATTTAATTTAATTTVATTTVATTTAAETHSEHSFGADPDITLFIDDFVGRGDGVILEPNYDDWYIEVSGRSKAWNGISIDVTDLIKSSDKKLFKISFLVKLGEGSSPCNVLLTTQINSGNSERYENIATEKIQLGEWLLLEGEFAWSWTEFDRVSVYVETDEVGRNNILCIDDFYFNVSESDNPMYHNGKLIYKSGFEYNENRFYEFGDLDVRVSSQESHSGTRSLEAYNRTEAWCGPCMYVANFIAFAESAGNYYASVWVKPGAGATACTMKMTTVYSKNGVDTYVSGAPIHVEPGKWTKLHAELSLKDYQDAVIYIETDDAGKNNSFFIDDFDFMIAD